MKHTLEIDSHAAPGSRTGDRSGRVLGINWQTEIGVSEELERLSLELEPKPPGRQDAPMPPKVATGRAGNG